jgi:GWxTD domain-containing protein
MLALVLAFQVAQAPPQVAQTSPRVCEATWPRPAIAWDSTATRDSMTVRLREAARAAPKDGEAWFAYGLFLTVTSSENLSDWRDRLEAQEALDQALRLLPGDPRPLAAFAVLRRKQGARIDARRLIRRAVGMVANGKGDIGHCFEAELYYQMAIIYRTWWEDWEGMTFMGGAVGSMVPCVTKQPRSPDTREENACPENFYDAMSRRADLTSMRFEDRDAVIENLEAAVAANPSHRDAQHALLLALYELQDHERFARVLRTALATDSLDPWLHFWGATEAYGRRDVDRAARYAQAGLRLLPASEREALLSVARIVPPRMDASWNPDNDSLYWRAADPLLLTDVNERLLAHVARVTYAQAKYNAPQMSMSGPDTDAGFMFVRYGRPWRLWQIPVKGEFGQPVRELIWAIDSTDGPLRLQRAITMRRWRFDEESAGTIYAFAESVPERWNAREVFDTLDFLPVEAARFEDAGHTVLDVYALWRNPYADVTPDSVHIGFFVSDAAMNPLLDRRRLVTRPGARIRLQFRAPLGPAFYWYRVETLTGPMRAAGRVRGSLQVPAPATDSLRTSDLLLGRSAREAPPTIPHRDSLHIDPLYNLQMAPGDSLVVYWETYGLEPDSAGIVHYHVAAEARGPDRSMLAGVIARLGTAIGVTQRSGVTVEWDVDAAAAEGVRRDVLVLAPTGWKPGSYLLRVRITEQGSGRAATSERRVVMEDAGS